MHQSIPIPLVATSHSDIRASLATWEHRLRWWNLNANTMSDGDMRALYVCGVSCAERIVRQLRADLARAESDACLPK